MDNKHDSIVVRIKRVIDNRNKIGGIEALITAFILDEVDSKAE